VLVDDEGFMVASGDLDQVVVDDGDGGLRRANIDEVTDPVLIAGVAAAPEQAPGAGGTEPAVIPFEVDGRSWQMALIPLAERQEWVAAVAAPEDEFVSEVVDAQRRNALLAVAISLGVTVLALPLVIAISRRFDRIAESAATDALTGLPNRRRFDELLTEHLVHASGRHPVCVASIDVDLFKTINDTWGHGVGDEALVAIAGRLRGALRDRDVVARVGGDEYAAILLDTPLDEATEALERARRAVGDTPARTAKGDVPMSVTIGFAHTVGGTDDSQAAVLERADQALYVAKEAGRNRVAGPDGIVAATVS
jgi:diguanylate cyclase (GGDEF)-like protein